MKLNPPKKITFWVSIVLAAVGLLGAVASIDLISTYAFWFLFVGYCLLALSLLVKGL